MANDRERWRRLITDAMLDTPGLPQQDVITVEQLLAASEWGLAFETLCTQLYEHEILMSGEVYTRLQRIGHQLNIDLRVVWLLRENVINAPVGPA